MDNFVVNFLLLFVGVVLLIVPTVSSHFPKVAEAKKSESSDNRRSDFLSEKKPSGNIVLHDSVQKPQQEEEPLNKLFETVFGFYHKELVPKRPTAVKLDLVLIKVKSTNEREGLFETVVSLFMEWKDKRLSWNSSRYGNITALSFDSDKVWLPDIAMTNSVDHLYMISKDTRFVVRASNDGTMKFVPTGTARTWCDLKLLKFPFDKQTCSFEFESWSMDSSWMTINQSSTAVVDESFSSPQWTLCRYSSTVYDHHYEFSGEIFTRVTFDFVVRRKPTFYLINLIFPCATLSMIQLMVFLIPSTDATSDRISFGTTNLLTLVVFQTIVTEEMPKSSDSVTALSKYIIALIVMSAVGILEAVAAERLLRPRCSVPPQWVLKIFRFPLLWESQLPSGISGMMLQQWSVGKGLLATRNSKETAATIKKEALQPLSSSPKNRRLSTVTPNPLLAAEEPRTQCLCKSNKGDNVLLENLESYGYNGAMRHSPSPIFGANGEVRFSRRLRHDSFDDSFSLQDSESLTLPTRSSSSEADVIEIGKMWGALVTRLDGFTFVCCTLGVVGLPLWFFLPVALEDDTCQ